MTRPRLRWVVAGVTALLLGGGQIGPLAGQEGLSSHSTAEPAAAVPRIMNATAVRLDGEIDVDGRLDDEAWQDAPVISGFVQGQPEEGAAPYRPSEVRVLFDEDALYIGARLYEDPDSIGDQLVRRDQEGPFDHFVVSLDPNMDGLTGYDFGVSAANVQSDAFLFDDTSSDEDWNAVWRSNTQRDSLGWTVEMRIPLNQIRYESRSGPQTWGVNFTRRRLASNSVSYFSLESRIQRGRVSQFGQLQGLEVSSGARRLEFLPYAASEVQNDPQITTNPLKGTTNITPRVGLDMSAGLGTAFSLDGTINPDFGQVEVDPEVINLTAFETFFPEKRPFFVRDAQVFEFDLSGRQNSLFFSRRIGREPRGSGPEGADYVDAPGQTDILAAGKLTGRTKGGLSVGVLAAATKQEWATGWFEPDNSTARSIVEPAAQHGVGRLQQDLNGGATRFGGIFTAQRRILPEDGGFDDLTSNAYSAGADFQHQWGGARGRDWRTFGFFAASSIRGPEEALTRIQRNSNHYFQRPDADYLEVDSTATAMTGLNWRLQFERQSAEHWTWSIWTGQITPGFEINDLGFTRESEKLDLGGRLSYQNITPGKTFRSVRARMFTFHNWRHSLLDDFWNAENWTHSYKRGGMFSGGSFEFHNLWEVDWGLNYSFTVLSDTKTRGGPLMTQPATLGFNIGFRTDPRKTIVFGPRVDYQTRAQGNGNQWGGRLDFRFRPAPAWQFQLSPSYSRDRNFSQYVTRSDAVEFEPTFGDRYLFGDLTRHTLSMDTRINIAFSPFMSLELFAQPLVSTGQYAGYQQLLESESFDFHQFTAGQALETTEGIRCVDGDICAFNGDQYVDFTGDGLADDSFGDRDFNIRSLRGSAVFRWEYKPGSVLFFVWQHTRRENFEEGDFGDFDIGRDLGGIFTAPSRNTFILKASYYLSF